jgi:hypothetical protein
MRDASNTTVRWLARVGEGAGRRAGSPGRGRVGALRKPAYVSILAPQDAAPAPVPIADGRRVEHVERCHIVDGSRDRARDSGLVEGGGSWSR